MVSHTFTIESPMSQHEAFSKLVDLSRVGEWDRGVSNAQQIDGDGPGLGAKYEVTVTGFDGKPTPVVYELTELDAPNRFVMIGENEALRAHDTLVLAATDSGCVLTYVGTLDLLGEHPPLTDEQLDSVFATVAGVAESGLAVFLGADPR